MTRTTPTRGKWLLVAILSCATVLASAAGCRSVEPETLAADYIKGVVGGDEAALIRATGHAWPEEEVLVMRQEDLAVDSEGVVEVVSVRRVELPPPDMVLGDSTELQEFGYEVEFKVDGKPQVRRAMVEMLSRKGEVLATGGYSLD
ncbi:MAG: hypothetical protein WBI63_01815 [Coriobacteriia bacterium]